MIISKYAFQYQFGMGPRPDRRSSSRIRRVFASHRASFVYRIMLLFDICATLQSDYVLSDGDFRQTLLVTALTPPALDYVLREINDCGVDIECVPGT